MNQTELNKSRIAEYNKAHVNDSAFSICDEWDESKHPRAANGQFGSGGATSAPTKASKAPAKANTSTPVKKPAQAKSTPANNASNTVDAFIQKFGHRVPAKEKEAIQETCRLYKEWGDALTKAAKRPTAQNIVDMHNKAVKYNFARMKTTKFSKGGQNCVDHMLFTMSQHSGLSGHDMQNADYMLTSGDEPANIKSWHRDALAKVKKAASKGSIINHPNAEVTSQSSLFV